MKEIFVGTKAQCIEKLVELGFSNQEQANGYIELKSPNGDLAFVWENGNWVSTGTALWKIKTYVFNGTFSAVTLKD